MLILVGAMALIKRRRRTISNYTVSQSRRWKGDNRSNPLIALLLLSWVLMTPSERFHWF